MLRVRNNKCRTRKDEQNRGQQFKRLSFNKIHVKHQNTEMAKKKPVFFLFCTNHSGSKSITNFYFEKFFFFCNSSKTFWLLYIFLKALDILWEWCAFFYPCIVTYVTTWEVNVNLIHESIETEVHNNTMGST